MTEEAKPNANPIGEAIHNVEQAHADDMSGASHAAHEDAPAAGEAQPDHTATVDVETDGKVHVETGTLNDKK